MRHASALRGRTAVVGVAAASLAVPCLAFALLR